MNKEDKRRILPDDMRVEIDNFEKQIIRIYIGKDFDFRFMDFYSFEIFAKKIYSSYKKFKYIFEKGK